MANVRPTLSPVILVPGLTGSVIYGRSTVRTPEEALWCLRPEWSRLWLEPSLLLPNSKGCLLRALELHLNVSTGTYSDTPDVQIDPYVDWSGVGGVAYLDPGLASLTDYFSALVQALTARGYTPGTNLHGAPYDWRLAPDAHMVPGGYYDRRLRLLIQTSVNRSAGHRAWIVAHSLGCPTASAFLSSQSDAWLATHIEGLVALARVWGDGATLAMAMVSGDNFGLPPIPLDYVRLVQRMSASGAWMLLAASAFGDSAVVRTPGRNYTASPASLLGMLRDLGLDQPAAVYAQLNRRRLSLDDLPPPRVRTAVFAGVGIRTERSVWYARNFSRGFGGPPDSVDYGDGDGSVNAESARVLQKRWTAAGPHNYSFRYLHGVSHFGIVREEAVLLEVLELMRVPDVQGERSVGWVALAFGGALVALRWASGGALSTALL
jgi:lysophospholipase-3